MPRNNSTNWSTGDNISATRLQEFNEDIDNLYGNWSDRMFCYKSWALQVTIGTWNYRVWNTEWIYAGATTAVTDNATNYIMLDETWTLQISTSAWDWNYARIAKVTAVSWNITTIEVWRADLIWWPIGTRPKIERQYIVAAAAPFTVTFSSLSTIDYILTDFSGSTDTSQNVSRNTVWQWFYDGTIGTCVRKNASWNTSATYTDRIVQLDFASLSQSATVLNSSLSITGNQLSWTLTNNLGTVEICFTAIWI